MSTRKVGIKRATENFYAATNRSQADTVYVFPDEQTLLLQLLKQNQGRLSPDPLKKSLIVNTLPVSFCRRVGLLWKISVALARQLGALFAESLLDGSAYVADLFSTAAKVSISLFSVPVASHTAEDCQRQHWNDHRSICRAISSGAWRTVVLDRFPGNTGMESASIYYQPV